MSYLEKVLIIETRLDDIVVNNAGEILKSKFVFLHRPKLPFLIQISFFFLKAINQIKSGNLKFLSVEIKKITKGSLRERQKIAKFSNQLEALLRQLSIKPNYLKEQTIASSQSVQG